MAQMPTDDMQGATPAMSGQDQTAAPDDTDAGSEPTVLCTILKNPDGTYQLVEGDEDDSDEEAGAGAEDTGGGEPTEQQGTEYDSAGPLLKAVLDLIEKDQQNSGDGTPEDNFAAGFSGEGPSKAKSSPAGKY